MRQVLVDHSRGRTAEKRGGAVTLVGLDVAIAVTTPKGIDVVALDEVLEHLSSVDERLCRVVELRSFAGLTIDETAETLKVSTATVERDWVFAKAWLYRWLSSPARGHIRM